MIRHLPALVAAWTLLAACAPTPQPATMVITEKPGTGAPTSPGQRPAVKPVAKAVPAREVILAVLGPSTLAKGGGSILNDDPTGIISDGGLRLLPDPATPLVAGYRLQAPGDAFKPIDKAVVTFHELTPEGKAISALAAQTDAKGQVTLKAVPGERPLEARAEFRIEKKTYRVAAAIPAGELGGMVTMVDPISTIVTARVRAILKANGKTNPALSFGELKSVWMAVNESGVTVDLAMLENARSLDELDAFYASLVAKITDPKLKQVVLDFMAKVQASP